MRSRLLVLAGLVSFASAYADCPAPPPALRDIIADSYYDDPPVYSHIDPVKHAAYEAAVKPIEHYLDRIAAMASRGEAACTLHWLIAWAEGDAMLGTITKEQAHYERKWVLSGLALSYAKVRSSASRDQKAAIDTWLQAIADGVMDHSARHKGPRNNHYYWEGLAVGSTGAVTGNKRQLEWSRKVFHEAMTHIADDGTLPREMARGARALHYHLFAAAPLAMLESILNEDSPRLKKLDLFCRSNTEMVGKRVGVEQTGVLFDDYYWTHVYRRHHFPPLPPHMIQYRAPPRAFVARLGGDLLVANPLEHLK